MTAEKWSAWIGAAALALLLVEAVALLLSLLTLPIFGFLLPGLLLLLGSPLVLLVAAIALIVGRSKHAVTAAIGSGSGFLIAFCGLLSLPRWP